MDWYNYYRDTYGKENVCWESCNPSEVASAWQGSYPYTGVDAYTNITLHDGDIIYMGEPFPTGYSITSEVAQTIAKSTAEYENNCRYCHLLLSPVAAQKIHCG